MGKFISAANLREMAKQGKEIVLAEDSVLTPSAKDLVKELGITIHRGSQRIFSQCQGQRQNQKDDTLILPISEVPSGVSGEDKDNTSEATASESELTKLIQRVIAKTLNQPKKDFKVVHAKGNGVPIPPFEEAPVGQKVGLRDFITGRDSNLCAGFLTFDHSELPWHLTYDEIDYVVEGDFDLRVGDQVFHAHAGDIISIPNDTKVVFSSPTKAKVFYVTYPANWADLC
ncbi:MAG: ethanolamine utilization protein [Bacillota bacterium]|nr:ethanolamine utilization protein [Bacillota bacterium]